MNTHMLGRPKPRRAVARDQHAVALKHLKRNPAHADRGATPWRHDPPDVFRALVSTIPLQALEGAFCEIADVPQTGIARHRQEFEVFLGVVNRVYLAHEKFPFNATGKSADPDPREKGRALGLLGLLEPDHQVEKMVRGKRSVGEFVETMESHYKPFPQDHTRPPTPAWGKWHFTRFHDVLTKHSANTTGHSILSLLRTYLYPPPHSHNPPATAVVDTLPDTLPGQGQHPWTEPHLSTLKTFIEDINVFFTGTLDAPFRISEEDGAVPGDDANRFTAIPPGTFMQTKALRWEKKSEKFVLEKPLGEVVDWLTYMEFDIRSKEPPPGPLASRRVFDNLEADRNAPPWHHWKLSDITTYFSSQYLTRAPGWPLADQGHFEWVQVRPGGAGGAGQPAFFAAFNFILNGDTEYPFSMAGELRRSPVWAEATKRLFEHREGQEAAVTFGRWLADTRALVKQRRAEGRLGTILPEHKALNSKAEREHMEHAAEQGVPASSSTAHDRYRLAEENDARRRARGEATRICADPFIQHHTIEQVSVLAATVPAFLPPHDFPEDPARFKAREEAEDARNHAASHPPHVVPPPVVAPAATPFAHLTAHEKAAFYRDISFWLVGSEESPFVWVEPQEEEEGPALREAAAELKVNPKWAFFMWSLSPELIHETAPAPPRGPNPHAPTARVARQEGSPPLARWMENVMLQSHRAALGHGLVAVRPREPKIAR